MKIGNTNITNLKLGIVQIKKVFIGLDLVWTSFLSIINDFKTRVLGNQGQFEGETCLNDGLEEIGIDLFDDASIVVTPNGTKVSKLYSIKPSNGTGDLTVTRATTATRVNSSGLIESVGTNIARLDYTNESCPSILVEPQRTNLVFPSATATTQTRTVTATAHTLSFYGTGSVTLSGVAIGTLNGTGANNRVTLTFTPTAGSLVLTVTGSVTNWQLEAGSNATSLIQTVSTSVTRNADIISKSGISSLIGQTEGTIYVETILQNEENLNSRILIALTFNTNSNIFGIGFKDNRIVYIIRNGGGIFNGYLSNTFSNGTLMKICCTYSSSNIKLFVNEVLLTSLTLTNFPNSFNGYTLSGDRLFFGGNLSPRKLIGLYTYALTDAQAIQLTTL